MEKMENDKPARAWVDENDPIEEKELPPFLRHAPAMPAWAVSDATREAREEESDDDSDGHPNESVSRKRFRSEGLSALLSHTEPLLESKNRANRAESTTMLSVLPLPRDAARTIQWHPNGQLVVVGGNHHVYTFHASGKYVERLSKVDVVKRVEHTCLTSSGEEVLVAGHDCYVPEMVSLSTEKLTSLKFLDTRNTAEYRNGRRDNSKKDFFITKLAVRTEDSATQLVGVASGRTVKLGSLRSASVFGSIALDDFVTDLCFPSAQNIAIAAGTKVLLYDIRKTATFVSAFKDDAVLNITSFAWSAHSLALGSPSGVVSLYNQEGSNANQRDRLGEAMAAKPSPVKVFKNLTTAIHAICFGKSSSGELVLAFSTRSQKAGFRLARLPSCNVVPSFPATAMRHGFVQSLAIAPTLPILSVGERQKVTNYVL